MKRFVFFLVFAAFFINTNCDSTSVDCSTVLCVGPLSIRLEVLSNNDNVFADGTYTLEDVTITGPDSDDLEVTVQTGLQGSTSALLTFRNVNWTKGSFDYTIDLGNTESFEISGDFVEMGSASDCCGIRLEVENPSAQGATVEESPSYLIITLE